jgi:hypothetical protein
LAEPIEVKRRLWNADFPHVPDSHLLATEPPEFSLEDLLPSCSTR